VPMAADLPGQNFTVLLPGYTISGNAGVAGVILTYNGGSTITDGTGAYSFAVSHGWTGTITPSKAGYSFTPASIQVTVPVAADLPGQNFAATLLSYTISGNAGAAGVTLTYNGGSTITDSTGAYSFSVSYGWTGTVTPVKTGYSFSPDHKDYASISVDLPAENYTATAVASFVDVPTSYWAWQWIEIVAKNGITAGCTTTPRQYCPAGVVTREQMAVFLLRAKHGPSYVPPAATGIFADVPVTYWAAAWIEQLANEGITAGCSLSPKLFCPTGAVTRDQMAIFLLRAEHGTGYTPPAATGIFEDAQLSFWAVNWIEQLTAEGVTSGCSLSPKLYCPAGVVTRGQMAVFLVKTFGLH